MQELLVILIWCLFFVIFYIIFILLESSNGNESSVKSPPNSPIDQQNRLSQIR